MKKQILFSLFLTLMIGQALLVVAESPSRKGENGSGAAKAKVVQLMPGRGKKGRTPLPEEWLNNPELRIAVIDGDLETVKQLISLGADINARDEYGNTALILATMFGQYEVAEELASRKDIDVHAQNKAGETVFDWASSKESPPPAVTGERDLRPIMLQLLAGRLNIKDRLLKRMEAKGSGAAAAAGRPSSNGN